MTYVKYFWGFDSSVEGWTGDNPTWEEGGVGGLPTGHLYGQLTRGSSSKGMTFPVTLKSPRNLTINEGDILCFVFTWDYRVPSSCGGSLNNVTVEVVDENENVVWSKTMDCGYISRNTSVVFITELGASGIGVNVKATIHTRTSYARQTHTHRIRLDSVTIYSNPDQIIHLAIPSTLQATVTHEIPINKEGNFVIGAIRFNEIQKLHTYNEKVIYDDTNELDYDTKITEAKNASKINKITITHNATSDLQVYYTVKHALWILDQETYRPVWFVLINCYHNQNVTNPDYVQFSTQLNGVYEETKSLSLKFVAEGLFKLKITPNRDIEGDTSNITNLTASIVIKDSNGNPIDSCNYDILNDSYDKEMEIPSNYDSQDLTIEVTIHAEGNVTETVNVNLKFNFEFTV